MKPENLEALLLDRSLGELTPEVEDLLRDHLALNPAAASRAEQLDATLLRARQAVAVSLELPMRALAMGTEGRKPGGAARFRLPLAVGFPLAACVVLGLGAGWYARSWWRPSTMARVSSPALTPLPGAGATGAFREPSGPAFWSVAYFRQKQLEKTAGRRIRDDPETIPWETLVK